MRTLLASLFSVGNVATMTSFGAYLYRGGVITPVIKSGLARISSEVTMPLLLFTNVVYCNQDWSDDDCPNVRSSLGKAWILVLYPLWLVGWGAVVGKAMAWLSDAPPDVSKALIACVAFGNSTGLPLTLLKVIHDSFSEDTELGSIDPSLYLSIYLLTYPVLQWSIGTWILEGDPPEDEAIASLHNEPKYALLPEQPFSEVPRATSTPAVSFEPSTTLDGQRQSSEDLPRVSLRAVDLLLDSKYRPLPEDDEQLSVAAASAVSEIRERVASRHSASTIKVIAEDPASPPLCSTLTIIASKFAQPAVVAALMGMLVACLPPLRGVLVDIKDRDNDAPLQWMFNGLYSMGQAAIPINMLILGCSLAKGAQSSGKIYWRCNLAATFGKMVVMPLIGTGTVFVMKEFMHISKDIDAPFILVMLTLTCTPTANSILVMSELGGQNKQAVSMCIFTMYCFAPLLLTFWVTVFITLAANWDPSA